MTGSTQPRDQSSSRAAADSRPLSSRVRKRQLRVDRARLPVRPSRCRKDATVPGTSIWMTRCQVTYIDTEFQRAGGDDDTVACLGECFLRTPSLSHRKRGVRQERGHTLGPQTLTEFLDLSA